MAQNGPTDPENQSSNTGFPKIQRVRNAVILPDGTKKEPLGSGEITGLLGVGGMANVYEIWNSQLEVPRAVKLLHPNYTEEARQRFQTEIKITAKLHHRNIIEIHAVGHWNGLPYIEMERIKGDTLEKIIADRGALPLEVCTAVATMIGRALWYAHNQEYVIYGTTYHGVIHRDLKPSNVMVTIDGIVKLMDFGIARPTDASIHTTDGAILGTMQYLSPEQLDGKEPDIRTDIYSLGTILYELLTGIKAFPENNISKLMLNKIKNDFKPLDQFDVKIPSRLRRLVHRCMVYDRTKRVPDAQAFLTEIGRIHRSISGNSPEQVVRYYLNEQDVIHTLVVAKRRLPLRLLAVGGLLCAASLLIWLGGRMVYTRTVAPGAISEARMVLESAPVASMHEKENRVLTEGDNQGRAADAAAQSSPSADRPAPLAAPVKTAVPPLKSTAEQLRERYGNVSLLDAFCKEVDRQSWNDALRVFAALPHSDAISPRAVVYKARALRALGRTAELRALLSKSGVEDGELYLEMAALAMQKSDIAAAKNYLKSSERTPGAFMESGTLRLGRLHLEALCAVRQYEQDRTDASRRLAMDRWYEVKSELRTARDHPWYREAEEQMQRIAGR